METNESKIFHRITPLWQVLIWVSIPIFLGLMSWTSWIVITGLLDGIHVSRLPQALFLIFGVFLYGCAILTLLSALKIYTVTSPLGLEYHGLGIHILTSWENMTQIALVGIAARFGIGAEVIKLSGSSQILSSNWLGRLMYRYQGGIPLLEFGRWRSSPLGAEIRKYAPRLLA